MSCPSCQFRLHHQVCVCRVGRTARAGKSGLAFTFLLGIQVKHTCTDGYLKGFHEFPSSSLGEKLLEDGDGCRKSWYSEADCQIREPEGDGRPLRAGAAAARPSHQGERWKMDVLTTAARTRLS